MNLKLFSQVLWQFGYIIVRDIERVFFYKRKSKFNIFLLVMTFKGAVQYCAAEININPALSTKTSSFFF